MIGAEVLAEMLVSSVMLAELIDAEGQVVTITVVHAVTTGCETGIQEDRTYGVGVS